MPPTQRVVAVLADAVWSFGADQAVATIVLVAGDDLAGLAAFFFDQVAGRTRTKLFNSRLGDTSPRTITLTVSTLDVLCRTQEILFSLKNRRPYRYQKNEEGDL